MTLSRYRHLGTLDDNKFMETSNFPTAEQLDKIPCIQISANGFDRLDILAAKHLGSGEYWWVIAVMNDLSWGFNMSEGSSIRIPVDLNEFMKLF